jgi:signal transduction histidine kinase/CheY-like chemotaxis protein
VAVGALWRASEVVTASEFESFARAMRERHVHLDRLAWVPRAYRDGREVYQVEFVEPPAEGTALRGLDLGSDPERRRAFEAAAATGREQLTGPVRLLTAPHAGEAIFGVFPVRRSGAGAGIDGFAVATVLVDRLLERALGGMRDAGLDLELADGGPAGSAGPGRSLAVRRSLRGGGGAGPLRQEASFDLAGRTWIVRTVARSVDPARGRSTLPVGVLAGGFLATGFVVAVFRVLARKNAALEREVSERRRAERASLALERQMFETQKLESLGTFAGGVAHDFNNILTGVLGNADLALRKIGAGHPASEHLKRVIAASERAATLTGQLLDYVGRGAASRERIDVGALVRDLGPLLVASISRKVALRLEPGAGTPRIDGDPTQVRQVVVNLVANGAEACDVAGGTVVVRTTASPDGANCVLEVEDSGSGIDAETLARIFDPFFTTKFTGRGLGLAAVHGIVRAHGGSIRVDSRPGRGTTFRVEFPAAPESPARAEAVPARVVPAAGAILVVDDEPVIRELVRAALEGEGHEVLEASDGSEAVSLFLERRHDIRLVVTDLTMPRMHGDEALAAIRAAGGELPAVLMTGYSEGEAAARFEALELRGILKKPFLRAELLETVRAALS